MSDLSGKFGSFEDQIAGNHTEIMNALDTIATALGAPPPGPTTTLADVVTALANTNTILTGIRSDMNEKLDFIFNTVDAINNNASLNAQRLIAVLLQTACPCDDTVPLLPPDLGTTPIDATDIAKCQRIQYFIDVFASWVTVVGVYVGNQGSISSFQVNNLLAIQLGEVGISTGELAAPMPTSVRDSIVAKIASAIGASSATAVNSGLFAAMGSSTNLEAMRQALYGVTTAAAGKSAIDSAIDGLGLDPLISSILKSMFYSAWPNDIYSSVPVVDASGYDGTICAPAFPPTTGCITLQSVSGITRSDGVGGEFIVWPTDGSDTLPSSVRPGGFPTITASDNIWFTGNLQGWWLKSTVNQTIYIAPDGDHRTMNLLANDYIQVIYPTSYVEASFMSAFELEICESISA